MSQWPIPPLSYFDYEVRPETGDAGTYFYHSHVEFQAISAHGPLLVEACGEPPYQYDGDVTMLWADYYSQTDQPIVEGLLASPFVWSGETDALVVNGQSGTSGFNNAADPSCSPYVIHVEPGKTYRMRFIAATAISLITLGIEGHNNLTIIEADGAYTKPTTIDHLQFATGQRFSILFQTKTLAELQALNQYSFWIQYENRERPANISGYAILSYNVPSLELPQSLPETKPLELPQTVYNWLEYALQPYNATSNAFPPGSTRTVIINVHQAGIYITSNDSYSSTLEWSENGDVWQTSRVYEPYLVNIYLNGESAIPNYEAALANGGWDPKSLAFPAKIGEVVDIVWQNNNAPSGGWDYHPFHAHGAHYWDLGSGNGTYDAVANDAYLAQLYAETGYVPVKRDTTVLYRYATSGVPNTTAGWRAWRLSAVNAGTWMMHCHILQHMIMGMQTVWVIGDAKQIADQKPEPYVSGYLEYGGSAYGNATYDPLVNHYFEGYEDEICSGNDAWK